MFFIQCWFRYGLCLVFGTLITFLSTKHLVSYRVKLSFYQFSLYFIKDNHWFCMWKLTIISLIWISPIIHYIGAIMTTMAPQITSLTVVYSTVYSDADQRKHQSSASLVFVGEFTGTSEFPALRASYAENVSIWWRHHVLDQLLPDDFRYLDKMS